MKIEELKQWFKKQPMWLQEAAKQIIEKGELTDEDCTELYEYCLNEAKRQIKKINVDMPINRLLSHGKSDSVIRLKSIGNIKNINKLSPKKALDFGDSNLSIIYGLNASGKSGYVRILKHICGANPRRPLFSNVYNYPTSEKKCTIKYQKGNEIKKKEWNTSDEKPIDDLTCLDIFDSECAISYIVNENEVTYEPLVLSFFSDLVNVCEKISSEIESEIDKNPSKKPSCPLEYNDIEGAKWYNEKLSTSTIEQDINNYCSWTEDNQQKLTELHKRLAQEDPDEKAKEIRKKNIHLRNLIDHTTSLLENLSNQKCKEINQLKVEYVTAKKTAKAAAEQIFKDAALDGVGSEIWKQLWQYAKEYSEQKAYKGQPFPVTSGDTLCVLCHQKLDEDAKSRFRSFKNFVKEEAQKAVENAKKSLANIIQSLPKIPAQEELMTKLNAAGLSSDNPLLKTLYTELENRKSQLISSDSPSDFIILPSIENWKNKAETIIKEREQKATQHDEDAKETNKDKLLAEKRELQVREWLSQQIDAIKAEVKRQEYIKILNSAQKLTDTTAISKKKSKLSEELITEDLVKRFNSELVELKADRIKVEPVKSKTEKGKAYHQIQLKGVNSQSIKTVNILSEGEIRIVALSAFLADVTGGKHSAPFVFDDPISSLDQNFEEAVAQRLVKLSKERQVIVFTHRLSTLGLLEEYAKQSNIEPDTLYVKEEHWGTGEPGDIPLFIKKPDKALNDLIDQLPKAKTLLETQGRDAYEGTAKSLVRDFRIIIENVIESVLLKDIVKRHRRKIHSQNVKDLTKISNSDCKFIDNLMTEYSKLLHSPTEEIPVTFPGPKKLEEDFKSLKNWIKEFRRREVHKENK